MLEVIHGAADRAEAHTFELRRGEALYEAGGAADRLFIVDSGCIETAYKAQDGRLLPVRQYRAGDIFGASGLLSGDDIRRDSALAVEPSLVRGVSHARMRQLMRQDSLLLEGLMRASSQGAESDAPPARTGLSGDTP